MIMGEIDAVAVLPVKVIDHFLNLSVCFLLNLSFSFIAVCCLPTGMHYDNPDWEACEFNSYQFYDEVECDNGATNLFPCAPGQLKVRLCIGQNGDPSRACDPCPQKFFQTEFNKCLACHDCSACGANERILNPCTDESDTVCTKIVPDSPVVVTTDPPTPLPPTTQTTTMTTGTTPKEYEENKTTYTFSITTQAATQTYKNGLTTTSAHLTDESMLMTLSAPVVCPQVQNKLWQAVAAVALIASGTFCGLFILQCLLNKRNSRNMRNNLHIGNNKNEKETTAANHNGESSQNERYVTVEGSASEKTEQNEIPPSNNLNRTAGDESSKSSRPSSSHSANDVQVVASSVASTSIGAGRPVSMDSRRPADAHNIKASRSETETSLQNVNTSKKSVNQLFSKIRKSNRQTKDQKSSTERELQPLR